MVITNLNNPKFGCKLMVILASCEGKIPDYVAESSFLLIFRLMHAMLKIL